MRNEHGGKEAVSRFEAGAGNARFGRRSVPRFPMAAEVGRFLVVTQIGAQKGIVQGRAGDAGSAQFFKGVGAIKTRQPGVLQALVGDERQQGEQGVVIRDAGGGQRRLAPGGAGDRPQRIPLAREPVAKLTPGQVARVYQMYAEPGREGFWDRLTIARAAQSTGMPDTRNGSSGARPARTLARSNSETWSCGLNTPVALSLPRFGR